MKCCNSCNEELVLKVNWAPCREKIDRRQCKKCATANHRAWLIKNRETARAINRRHRLNKPETHMVYEAKKRAILANVSFSITPEDIVIPERCPVFGYILEFSHGQPAANSPALDRIIPELGYVPDNIVVISHRANNIKGNASLDELIRLTEWLSAITNQEKAAELPRRP